VRNVGKDIVQKGGIQMKNISKDLEDGKQFINDFFWVGEFQSY